MKSTFLLGILATALADPPVAERHLSDFKFGDQPVGTISGTPCNFMSTADIFSFKVDAGFSNDNGETLGQDHDLFNDVTFGTNHIGTAHAEDWDSLVPIHLGTFEITLELTNMQTADVNYNYFKFNNDEWSAETDFTAVDGSATAKKKKMASVCFYKNSAPTDCDGADYTQKIEVALPTIGATVSETTQPTELRIRKVLGVASQCGVDDTSYDLTGGAEDIFAWATLEASNMLHYNIEVTNTDTVGEDDVTGAHDLSTLHTSGVVTYALTVAHDHQVHDLLFVDGKVLQSAQTGTFETVPQGSLEISYNVGYRIDGDVTRAAQAVSQTNKCSSTLTVDAMGGTNTAIPAEHSESRDAVWHCFRGTAESNLFPTTNSNGTVVQQDSEQDDVLEALNEAAQTFTHSACSAKLVVNCVLDPFTIAGTDDRSCIADDSGEASGATTDEVDGAAGSVHGEEDCIQSAYWLRNYKYLAYDPIGITYEAAIIQAVRLRSARQYPKNAKAEDATATTVTSLFGRQENLLAQVTNWECDDALCTNDPYKILAVSSAGSAGISCPSSGDLKGGNAKVNGVYSVSKPTWSQACTVDNPTQISIQAGLQAPPANYPESYVFAAVSYTETKATTAGPKITERDGTTVTEAGIITMPAGVDHIHTVDDNGDEAVNAGDIDETNAAARRLRSAKATGSTVHYFSVTDAVQHGISE